MLSDTHLCSMDIFALASSFSAQDQSAIALELTCLEVWLELSLPMSLGSAPPRLQLSSYRSASSKHSSKVICLFPNNCIWRFLSLKLSKKHEISLSSVGISQGGHLEIRLFNLEIASLIVSRSFCLKSKIWVKVLCLIPVFVFSLMKASTRISKS